MLQYFSLNLLFNYNFYKSFIREKRKRKPCAISKGNETHGNLNIKQNLIRNTNSLVENKGIHWK